MSILFINTMTDTFTPTNSFSTGTWVWELCRLAQLESLDPWVISSDSPHAPYNYRNLVLIPAPRKPSGWVATKLDNQFRHRTGWVHPGQRQWCHRVVTAIKRRGLQNLPMVLSNDIELAVFLRRTFPNAFILHQAHGENGAKEPFRASFRRAVNVACGVSDCTRVWNEAYYGFQPGEMKTLLNGANLEKFHPADPPIPGPPVINFHGRLDPEKGPDLLLSAAALVARRTKGFSIQLVGRKFNYLNPPNEFDRQLESLEKTLAEMDIRVQRTGWVDRDRLPDTLRRAHINVVCSRWKEPSALAIYEGLATGLATIGSRAGGTPQVVGAAGLLFDNENVEQFAEHLGQLVTDREFRQYYARLARQRAGTLTWDKTWRELKQLAGVSALQAGSTGTRSFAGCQ